jgi:hypothetical protein
MEKSTFLGNFMAQSPQAIAAWEQALQHVSFQRIIELGTGHGTFSLYLLLFCRERGAQFFTYDNVRRFATSVESTGFIMSLLRLDDCFKRHDVLAEPGPIIEKIKKPGRTVLFCDDGDKKQEVRTFGPHLKPGDILGVHDWHKEVNYEDIRVVDNLSAMWSIRDPHTRFFMKEEPDVPKKVSAE